MKNLFIPNKSIDSTVEALLIFAQVTIVAFIWLITAGGLVPSPGDVVNAWLSLLRDDGLIYELYISFGTNLEAIGITCIISLVLSYLTVLPVMRPLVSFCSKSRFFGMTGFTVLFTLMFGGGHGLKVALLVFGMSVFFITSMASVVASIPKEEFDHARTLRMGEWRVVLEVIVLGKIDYVFEIIRQNAAIGWVMLTMVEGLTRSEGGLGALMLNQNKHFKLDAVLALQITVLVVGILQDYSIKAIKNIVCPYADLTNERK